VVSRHGRHVHLLARWPSPAPEEARPPVVEQGRRGPERVDVPPRRRRRPAGGTGDRGTQAPIVVRLRRR
jgi:hypothetical protein